MKLRAAAAMLVIYMFITPKAVSAATDISGHWAEEMITYSINQGYISGYADGTFRPNSPIKRAEFVALANKSMGYATGSATYFSDVSPADWFYNDVAAAQREGYISGFSDGTFRPNDVITRETAAVMAANMLHLNQNTEYASYFTDSGLLSWSKGYVGAAVKAKIITGYTNGGYNPSKPMTRAEAVSLINRVAGRKYDTSLDIMQDYKSYYAGTNNYDSTYIPEDRLNYQSTSISTTTTPDAMGNYRLYNGNYGVAGIREEFLSNVLYDARYAGTVRNIYVRGDFELSTSIHPDAALVLEDVEITGKLIVYNIGKVTLKNSEVGLLEWRSGHAGSMVTATGNTRVDGVRVYSSVRLEEESVTNGAGLRNIVFDESCGSGVKASFYGDCNSITLYGNKARLVLEKGTVDAVEIAEKSSNCIVEVQKNAKLSFLEVNSSCYVEGYGVIALARISAPNAVFDLIPQAVSAGTPVYTSTAHGSTYDDGSGVGKYNVSITVVDSNGNALSGVKVQLGILGEKTTASEGKVNFTDIPNGTYNCVLSLSYSDSKSETVVVKGSSVELTFVYDVEERYTVVVTVKENDVLLDGVNVSLVQINSALGETATTINGKAVFENVRPGIYEYSATYNGVTKSGSVTVKNLNVPNAAINF